MKKQMLYACSLTLLAAGVARSNDNAAAAKPEDTEQWQPVPVTVSPGEEGRRGAFRRHRSVRRQEPGSMGHGQ